MTDDVEGVKDGGKDGCKDGCRDVGLLDFNLFWLRFCKHITTSF